MPIDWQELSQQLGARRESMECGGDDLARKALAAILGTENIIEAVDHYIAARPGYELSRSVLLLLRPELAVTHCLHVYRNVADLHDRRAAVEFTAIYRRLQAPRVDQRVSGRSRHR